MDRIDLTALERPVPDLGAGLELTTELSLDRLIDGQQVVVLVTGELDLLSAPEFTAFVCESMVMSTALGVDLSGVTFLDSSGVRALVHAARAATGDERSFVLFCPVANTAVRRVLELLHLGQVMTIVQECPPGWPVWPGRPEVLTSGPRVPARKVHLQDAAAGIPLRSTPAPTQRPVSEPSTRWPCWKCFSLSPIALPGAMRTRRSRCY